MWREGALMEMLFWCFGLIIGFTMLCFGYSKIGLRGKNTYLKYSMGLVASLHGCAQIYLILGKWKQLLLQNESFLYFQIGVLIVGLFLFVINIFADRYIIKLEQKKEMIYRFSHVDEMRRIAIEKNASREIQDLLKYITPKECDPDDDKIKELLLGLSEENMVSNYDELKRLIKIREEKLKAQCR